MQTRFPPVIAEPRPDGYTRRVILGEGKTYRATDLHGNPHANPEVVESGIRSTLGVPMKVQDRVIGALFVHSCQPSYFTEHHEHLLEYLAVGSAMVLDNARRYRESVVHARLLTALERTLRNVRATRRQ